MAEPMADLPQEEMKMLAGPFVERIQPVLGIAPVIARPVKI